MGKLIYKSDGCNENYLAKIVKVDNLRKHPNADKLQVTTIDGNDIITNMDTKEGDIKILFVLESAIAPEYLSANNDFRDKELNADKEKGGFFEAKGRVKAMKLRGLPSEGYIVPVETLSFMLSQSEIDEIKGMVGTEFDMVKELKLCKKYVVKVVREQGQGKEKGAARKARESKLIEGQFQFHFDSHHLGKNVWKIEPKSLISVTDKWHGTSVVVSNLLCKKPLTFFEKVLKKLGVNVVDTHYDLIYSSRKVIKNSDLNPNANHYYKSDIWGTVAKEVEPFLHKGETLYGEIVGYTTDGAAIQGSYDYGCAPKEHKFLVYRITQTNVDGKVIELSRPQIIERCAQMGVETVKDFYYGYAKDLYPDLSVTDHWHEEFLLRLKKDYLERKCTYCKNDVWAEGVIVRIEGMNIENLKLKCFNFVEYESKQMDKGEVDIESEESVSEEG